MEDVWPKLLITSNTTTGMSYWHISSREHLHQFCLDWLLTDIETGYALLDTFKGTFADFLNNKYKNITPEMTAYLVENNYNFLKNDLAEYEFFSKRQSLVDDSIKALENEDGELAVSVLQAYAEMYENDLLGKCGFELVDYAEEA